MGVHRIVCFSGTQMCPKAKVKEGREWELGAESTPGAARHSHSCDVILVEHCLWSKAIRMETASHPPTYVSNGGTQAVHTLERAGERN